MYDSDLVLIEDGLRRVLIDGGTDDTPGRLVDFGWFELFGEYPGTAIRLIFGQQGNQSANWSALGLVMSLSVGAPISTVVRDETATALVLPALCASTAPARSTADADVVDVDGIVLGAPPDRLLLLCDFGDHHAFGDLEVCDDLISPVGGLDPELGLRRVAGLARFTPRPLEEGVEPVAAWLRAVSMGRLGLASELTAIGGRVLRRAVDHVVTRLLTTVEDPASRDG
ncbi:MULTISPECIES: hypothetical protein [unclassified Mycobacterium]|uniref:hypothetical protein n=1 Tax=unclassified Mycobacterium TaxID=2642494 RepID=UPI0007400668|nr:MULTISPECIES: hypothetical protein [unclassified Mycobacterium]KUH84537.1 hypothetical protein AU186_12520 [Mycobacterium sp. GA-1999]KUH85916.1 hypothetical protein AU185_11630 [Mycobacterium sp. GA-0227b]